MAQIVINEISQNYSWSASNSSYATVAMPITSCWGPGYFDPDTYYSGLSSCEDPHAYMLEHTAWQRFPATQAGMEAFVSAYRGPASVYRKAKDFSYQMALTLLTAGYDVLVCRICPGVRAEAKFTQEGSTGPEGEAFVYFRAKYPGTFGNNLQITIKKNVYYDTVSREKKPFWSIITHIIDSSGVKVSAENLSMVFNPENATDSILHYSEISSNFWDIEVEGTINEGNGAMPIKVVDGDTNSARLTGGDDVQAAPENGYTADDFQKVIAPRYNWASLYSTAADLELYNDYTRYPDLLTVIGTDDFDDDTLRILYYKEWIYSRLVAYPTTSDDVVSFDYYEGVLDLLKDKLAYNPNRLIGSGWDDQDYTNYLDDMAEISNYIMTGYPDQESDVCPNTCILPVSPLHLKIMDVAYYSRCATGFIDIPRVVDRKYVHIEDEANYDRAGYAQKLARVVPYNAESDVNGSLYQTHSALFAPWGQYTYVGTGKMNIAAPSFLTLLIQRAQILNQAIQYEWALPTNRRHNLRIGKMDYTVPKKLLDKWQKLEGASVNVITAIPDMGTNLWGNSTLYEVPPATYQALANLSTRFLVNAVEDCAYRCGIGITFQYNNNQAYNKFYAGVTPLLDTMKNVGAIDDYKVRMSADINSLDRVNANTVIGKIWLVINGVINDIYVDLIALPSGTDLSQFGS